MVSKSGGDFARLSPAEGWQVRASLPAASPAKLEQAHVVQVRGAQQEGLIAMTTRTVCSFC